MLERKQLGMIHVAAKKAGLDDPAYRLVLANVAGVESAKDLSQGGFEDVMAVLEDLHGEGTYWRATVAARGRFANRRLVRKIEELHGEYVRAAERAGVDPAERYKLPGLVAGACGERTRDPARLAPYQAYNLIEQLKKIIARTAPAAPAPVPAATVAAGDEIPF
jgi:hypothetical protein